MDSSKKYGIYNMFVSPQLTLVVFLGPALVEHGGSSYSILCNLVDLCTVSLLNFVDEFISLSMCTELLRRNIVNIAICSIQ